MEGENGERREWKKERMEEGENGGRRERRKERIENGKKETYLHSFPHFHSNFFHSSDGSPLPSTSKRRKTQVKVHANRTVPTGK